MSQSPEPIEEYLRYKDKVQTVNNVYDGAETASQHLEQFEREDKTKFEKRQAKATLDNYVFSSIQTRKNIIFRKPIDLTNIKNTELLEWCESDFDLKGTSLNEFAKDTAVNIARDGFAYVLVDTASSDDNIVTVADEKEANVRPYAINIKRADLFYWETDIKGNFTVVAFNESYEVRSTDGKFGFEVKTQVKVLFSDGTFEVYRDEKLVLTGNRGINEITIKKFDKKDIPSLLSMAKINLKLLNTESELSHYTRVTLALFPLVFGQREKDAKVTLDVQNGLAFTDKTESGFEWAETKGINHKVGMEELNRLTAQMQRISVSFNTESNIKTATQTEKESTEDESQLTDEANIIEDGFNEVIQFFGLLKTNLNVTDNKIIVNKDFSSNTLSPEQVARLENLFLIGSISRKRLNTLLEKGEILTVLNEEEQAKEDTELANDNIGGAEV